MRRIVGLLVLAIALTACGALSPGSSSSQAPQSDAPVESIAPDAAATIHAEISGGPLVGTYDAESSSPICTSGLGGEGAFGVQFSVDQPDGLSRVEVLIPVAALAQTGTDQFTASIGLGPLVGGTTFHIDPNAEGATGTARLDYDGGNSATLMIEGETAEGIGVSLEVECHQVVHL
jgi:hypothetical protein